MGKIGTATIYYHMPRRNKWSLSLFFFTLMTLSGSVAQEASVTWFGFSQITAEGGHGAAEMSDGSDNGLHFGSDRIRIGFKAKRGRAFAKLQVDFNRPDISRVTAGMPEIIKDAEVGYTLSKFASAKAGMFKTPVGMDFNTSGSKLDITKRGMEKRLALERTLGLMVSGRKVFHGLGYDLGVFNPAARGPVKAPVEGPWGTEPGAQAGVQYAYAIRALYDRSESIHAEISYGLNEEAGGTGSRDYNVWDAGVSYRRNGITFKGEWIKGSNIHGDQGIDQQVWYVHAGIRLLSRFEPVIRHYQGKSEPDGSPLGNTFLGVNIFLIPEAPHAARIQLNYVIARQSRDDWQGLGGYTENAFLSQFQFAF